MGRWRYAKNGRRHVLYARPVAFYFFDKLCYDMKKALLATINCELTEERLGRLSRTVRESA